jgi:uncharacterized protein YlxW (UPF0749 family)
MEKLKLFAKENKGLIIQIFFTILFNVFMAIFVVGEVAASMRDIQTNQREERSERLASQKEERKSIQQLAQNLNTVASSVKDLTFTLGQLNERVNDMYTEHIELMNLHHLPPHKWRQIEKEDQQIKPFPK